MRTLAHRFTGLAAVLALAGCSPQQEEGSGTMAASSMVSEIPITTSSEEALAAFKEGEEALDIGRFLDANAAFRRAVEKDPNFAYGYLNIANSAQSVTEFKENLDLAAARAEGVSEGEKLLIAINMTFLNNDADRRLQLANELVEKYPSSPRAWLSLAGVQGGFPGFGGGLNRNEEARISMNRAVELDPDFFLPYLTLGFSYLFGEPKDFAKAEYNMRRVVELKPEESPGHVNLGDVHRAAQDLEAARAAYTRATELDPENGVAFVKKGHVNSFLGNFDEARADYDRSLEVAKDEQRANYANYRAFVHLHAGDPQGAVQELGKLVDSVEGMGTPADQVNGSKIFALTNQVTIALHHGMFDVAERSLKHRAQLVMENANRVGTADFTRSQEANVVYWEGLLAAYKGDFDTAAMKAEANAKLVEPDNNPRKLEPYHNVMGLISLRQGNYADAVDHLQQANHLNNMYIRFELGLAHEGAGNTAQAQRIFKEVAEFNFNSVGYALVRKEAQKKLIQRVSLRN